MADSNARSSGSSDDNMNELMYQSFEESYQQEVSVVSQPSKRRFHYYTIFHEGPNDQSTLQNAEKS